MQLTVKKIKWTERLYQDVVIDKHWYIHAADAKGALYKKTLDFEPLVKEGDKIEVSDYAIVRWWNDWIKYA